MAAEYPALDTRQGTPTGRPAIDYPFSAIPWDLIGDKEVSATAVRVYGVLARFAFEGGEGLQVTHDEIAARLQCSPRTVARPLRQLEESGWIERRLCNTGMGRRADYFFLNSQRADMRGGLGAQRAESRTRDRAILRGPTTLKEEEKNLTLVNASAPTRDSEPSAKSLDDEFEVWWQEWPSNRRVKKVEARREYHKARKRGFPAEDMLDGCIAFARLHKAQATEPKFIVHPSRWLKNERWTDDVDLSVPSPYDPPPMRFG